MKLTKAAGATIGTAAEAFAADFGVEGTRTFSGRAYFDEIGHGVVGMLNPFDAENIAAMAAYGLTAFSPEAAPRITRAQSLDVLSSQANIAGYKAVMLAANTYQRFMPMLMTAAGTVKAARVLIMGSASLVLRVATQTFGRGDRSIRCTSTC